jgi:uncharacterized protein (TIGR02996 family)
MTHEDAFLQEVLERPEDDTPRLVFADWLDDHGEHDRAEFIRLQIERTRITGAAPALDARIRELLAGHDEEWAGPVISGLANGWEYQRGFVHELTVEGPALAGCADELFAAAPIRHLRLLGARDHLPAIVACPHMTRLLSLDLANNRLGDGGVALLSRCRFLGPLARLNLRHNDVGPDGVKEVVASRHLRGLRWLDLSANRVGPEGALALAQWPALDRLVQLDLWRNDPHCGAASLPLKRRLGLRILCPDRPGD